MGYGFVKDRAGVAGSTRDRACAMSTNGSTVYVAEEATGSFPTGRIVSMDWPTLGNETTVYTAPTDWRVSGVAATPSGPKAVVWSTVDGHVEVRDLTDVILYDSAPGLAEVNQAGAVWNPVDQRLYVLFVSSGVNTGQLVSMLEDGTDQTVHISSWFGGSRPIGNPRPIVTPDGALWWPAYKTGENPRPARWYLSVLTDGPVAATFDDSPLGPGLAIEPDDTNDTLTTLASDTRQYRVSPSPTILIDSSVPITPPDVFDGWLLRHGAVNATFTRGVAFGVARDDGNPGTAEGFRWWRFGGRRWWIGSTGFSR